MQSRHYHELDHMRNASQRPSPSRSLDRATQNSSSITASSYTHTRSQSSTTHNHEHVYSSPKAKNTYFERSAGGWLESSPVRLSASTSHSSPPQISTTHNEPVTNEGCSKDMLGTISNDDILKLTQLTNKLPMVSTKYNHIQKEHSHSRQRQHLAEDELVQPSDEPTGINNSQQVDTGITNLLNQDFMMSSPISDTGYSALLTIPSCNPSTISTDTDDSHFSWHNNNSNKFSKPPPVLRKTLSERTTATSATEKWRLCHPRTVSTTALYSESDLTPSSSQLTRHGTNRWYRSLMKRDRKGKTRYNNSPLVNDDEPTFDTGYATDEPPSSAYHTLQHEPTIATTESNIEHRNLRYSTHPVVNMTENGPPPSDPATKNRHANLSIHRLRLPTRRRKRRSSLGLRDDPSTDKPRATEVKQQQQRPRRRQLYGRRHSFDNIRDYDTPPPSHDQSHLQRQMTITSAATRKTKQQYGKSQLNDSDTLAPNTSSHISSSTPSIASTASSLSVHSPSHIPSSNISPSSSSPLPPPPPTTVNQNDSSSTLAVGLPKTNIDELKLDDIDINRSATNDSTQKQPIIEIVPAVLPQSDQKERQDTQPNHHQHRISTQKTLYFDYDSLPWDNAYGEPQGVKALVKRMVDNGYGRITESHIQLDNNNDNNNNNNNDEDEEYDGEGDTLGSKMDEDMSSGVDEDSDDSDNDNQIDKTVDIKNNKHHGTTHPTIESSKVIGGDAYYSWLNKRRLSNIKAGTRRIAEIHVAVENDTGFVKLTQFADETTLIKGRLLNLYVSFLVPEKTDDDIVSNYQETAMLDLNVNDRLSSLNPFIDDAKAFLAKRTQQSRDFVPMENPINVAKQQQRNERYQGSRKNSDSSSETDVRYTNTSSCSLSSFSSIASILPSSTSKARKYSTASGPPPPRCSPHSNGSSTCLPSLWNYALCQEYSAYDSRQEQLRDAISDLRRGMEDFKRSLKDTEGMVHGVQVDMNDTKAKMDTYLKDVPETHYSELKRLEVGIESILANRAKSRGMELLYWLLTALLTGSAFLLWAVICILKFGQSTISFPGKMIKVFNEHIEERNREVKQAGRRIVAKGVERPRPSSIISLGQSPSFLSRTHSDELDSSKDVPTGSTLRRSSSNQTSYSPITSSL